MYNMTQFQQPMNFPAMQQQPEVFAPTKDLNSNPQSVNLTTPQFSMPSQIPQTQINLNLPGMPPLTVNTPRIDPKKYAVP